VSRSDTLTPSQSDTLAWRLMTLLEQPDMPTLDIEWLLLRCGDTHRMTDDWQRASLRQLWLDMLDFDSRFPTLIHDLVERWAESQA
jgi:hypothetical protein